MSSSVEWPATISTEDKRALLAERLRKAAGQNRSSPLSFPQQRLWFLDQLQPDSPRYNIPSVARLKGRLDVLALEQSVNAVAARHDTLRTRFISTDGKPAQVIDPEVHLKLQAHDLSELPEAEREAELERVVRKEVNRPFNLNAGQLLRATLVRLNPEEHVLIVVMHHIVSDEWSFKIFFRELTAFYQGRLEGKAVSLPELPVQYADYAAWQQDWLQGPVFERQLRFWKEQLRDNPPGVELPTDRPRRPAPISPGAGQWLTLTREFSDQLKELARQEGATLFMVLLAAFKVLLYRYTQQQDIIVGSPMAGRNRLETEGLIGFFVNTLPLRSRLSSDLSFQQFLKQVREVVLGAYSHQDLPFEKLVEALKPERSLNQTPFINIMFLTQQGAGGAPQLPGLEIEFLESATDTTKFDVTLALFETDTGLLAKAEYNADLFEARTVERLLQHYERLLQAIVAQPTQLIGGLPLLSEAERRQLLVEWNNTRTEYPRNRCVHELFEEQAREHPGAVAVTFEDNHLTYAELNAKANQVAHKLRRSGVKSGTIVGIWVERSLEMIVGLLGILKAGGAYAPLDPSLPQQRLDQMLDDLNVAALVAQEPFIKKLPQKCPSTKPLVLLDSDRRILARESIENLCCETSAEDLAYISFTSGSTGRPKGVCVPHRGVVRLVRNTNYATFSPAEVFLQMAPVSFDASTLEIWGALLNGGRVVVFPPRLPSLSELAEIIRRNQVTTAWFTSGFLNQIVQENPECLAPLRQVLTGGDVLSPPHIKKALTFLRNGRLINGYGPTENTTFTACYTIPADFNGEHPVPIGRPISNSECYVLDECLQPVPIGVPGELYAGGDGLALGYLNRPELTAEKFIANPFQPGSRLYRTGDLVKHLADGTLDFLGRVDLQVKIRGFRVELGEIETALLQHPGVRECAVIARADAAATKQLLAYIVPREQPAPAREQLQQFLRQRLPEYMIPAFFVTMEELPLSPTGKVNRRALPTPELSSSTSTRQVQPKDEVERQLQLLWETLLDVRPIGVRDNFFALGGHSLLAVRLVSQIEKAFAKKVRVAAVFENPTIEGLAALLRDESTRGSRGTIVEIQPRGSKPPLFLVHGAGGGMFWGYSNLARHLDQDQPVFAFKSRGMDGLEEPETIEALAEAYLQDLRKFQPRGPYYLGGYCFGGLIALEMAHRLHRGGEKVPFLGLINSSPPNSSYAQFQWTPVSALRVAYNVCLRTAYTVRSHPEKLTGFFKWKAKTLTQRLQNLTPVSHSDPGAAGLCADEWIDLSEYSEEQRKVWQAHLNALVHYHPKVYPGHITLFRSPVHLLFCSFDPNYGWHELAAGSLTVRIIPGAHETIMEEPGVQNLARHVQSCLAQAQTSAGKALFTDIQIPAVE